MELADQKFVPQFNVNDYIGNRRITYIPTYTEFNQKDYSPYGNILWENNNNPERLSFLSKEKDEESNLGDFGVRKYDDLTGRFTAIDPLWEKFYGWSPYMYSANNPVNAVDLDGRDVRAMDDNSRLNIINSVEKKYQHLVKFDSKGYAYLSKNINTKEGQNIHNLKFLIEHEDDIEVYSVDANKKGESFVKYIDKNGVQEVDLNNLFGIEGLRGNGVALIGNKYCYGDTWYSLNNNHQVNISTIFGYHDSDKLIKANAASTTAHELYHIYLFLNNKPRSHDDNPDGFKRVQENADN